MYNIDKYIALINFFLPIFNLYLLLVNNDRYFFSIDHCYIESKNLL